MACQLFPSTLDVVRGIARPPPSLSGRRHAISEIGHQDVLCMQWIGMEGLSARCQALSPGPSNTSTDQAGAEVDQPGERRGGGGIEERSRGAKLRK
ncbi:hypothetical protein ACO22_05173 [Paracoccidioides brasiliensis]|uniref:Uncharacterized protein n=1 Tax=Paracoccidioides brasiliensis TaxID=121759 RepID=A0A1D2JB18_PARBR|nr:hypothetical protein ACO22_05173 [Paracoccidioides brasiliensis]